MVDTWLLFGVMALALMALLALLWLLIEFPGLCQWQEVHKESPEGRASQERWRRDSVMLSQRGRTSVIDMEELVMKRKDTVRSETRSSSGVSSASSRQLTPDLERVHSPRRL